MIPENTSKENIKHIEKIVFYNHFNNGDIFVSKPFVQNIVDNFTCKYSYVQKNDPIILAEFDLEPTELTLNNLPHNSKLCFYRENTLCINTWIGNFLGYGDACNLKTLYKMHGLILENINPILGSNLKLNGAVEDYYPSIPKNTRKHNIDAYFLDKHQKKILFCNSPALSNQSIHNGDMQNDIINLAKKYSDHLFIITKRITHNISNIVYSGDIINIPGCDLNEISYLSSYCDVIIGRNSGPFTFAWTKENSLDTNKKFVCFGQKVEDSMEYDTKVLCEAQYILDSESYDFIVKTFDKVIANI